MASPGIRSATALGSSLGIQSEGGTQFLTWPLLVRVLRLSDEWQECRGVILVVVFVIPKTRAMDGSFTKSLEARCTSGVFLVGL